MPVFGSIIKFSLWGPFSCESSGWYSGSSSSSESVSANASLTLCTILWLSFKIVGAFARCVFSFSHVFLSGDLVRIHTPSSLAISHRLTSPVPAERVLKWFVMNAEVNLGEQTRKACSSAIRWQPFLGL